MQPCKKELTRFNRSTSIVMGVVNVLRAIEKGKKVLPYYVLDYGTHPIIRYPGLKSQRLLVNCVLDTLVGEYGDRVWCNVVRKGDKAGKKEKKEKKSDSNQEKYV